MALSSSRPLLLILLLVLTLAISSIFHASASPAKATADPDLGDDDEYISFLEEVDDVNEEDDPFGDHGSHYNEEDAASFSDEGEFDDDETAGSEMLDEPFDGEQPEEEESVDESDVVVLTDKNFSDFLASRRHVMVEFYAPWCGHCQALAPEYAAAATALKGEDVALAKVDATEENELAQRFEIQGFPTVLFFVDGVQKDYPGQRSRDAIVTWIKKKIGPGVTNITTVEEAEKILADESKLVLCYFNSLVGADSQEFAAASKLEDGVNFYQTTNPDVAKIFHLEPDAKRPSVVLLKKEAEKIAFFDGQFSKSAVADFVFANKLPLVTTFTREAAPEIFDNPIKKQLLLFAVSNDTEKVLPVFQEAAKFFKGKLIFIYVERDNEDVGKPVSEYFGVTGDGPKVLAYSGNEDAKKYFLDGELTVDNIKRFSEDFLEDKLNPFYKSDPVPETNDGDVKIVVGNNFDEIVLDESKDVLLEIYAPWCGHCQAFEPTYNKLAKHLRGIESLVIAKMDGTTNEHPRAKPDGYPTILFFPAGNKSFNPITVDTDRTVVALYKFIKKHAAIPFKLQRPVSTKQSEAAVSKDEHSTSSDAKDEL